MAYIYCITNLINGKQYVGKTTYSITKRFKEHCQDCGTEITKEATYCVKCNAKHRRKVNNRPNKEELISLYKKYKSFVAIGNLYEVSDRAIAKWYAAEGLPSKVSELKKYLQNLDTN